MNTKASPECNLLVQFMRDRALANEVATFEEMSALVHCDVQDDRRSLLQSALYTLARDYAFFPVSVPTIGYRFSQGAQLLDDTIPVRFAKIKSQLKKAKNQLVTIDPLSLDRQQVKKYIQADVKIQIYEIVGSEKVAKRIQTESEQKTINKRHKINLERILSSGVS